MTMLESEVEAHFVWTVAMMGGLTWKVKAIGRMGFPDRCAAIPGEVWLVELKRPKGRLRAAQEEFAADMVRLKENYACLWSIPMIDTWARERGYFKL